MSQYLARTNQKLNFVRQHLSALESAIASSGWHKHNLVESYVESVLFHLNGCYLAYLAELANSYNLAADRCEDLDSLGLMMLENGYEVAEWRELRTLEDNSQSWLYLLHQAYAGCFRVESREAAKMHASASEIQVVQVAPSHKDNGQIFQQLSQWTEHLSALIERHRQAMQEC